MLGALAAALKVAYASWASVCTNSSLSFQGYAWFCFFTAFKNVRIHHLVQHHFEKELVGHLLLECKRLMNSGKSTLQPLPIKSQHTAFPGIEPIKFIFICSFSTFSTWWPRGHSSFTKQIARCCSCQRDREIWKRGASPCWDLNENLWCLHLVCHAVGPAPGSLRKRENPFAIKVGYYMTSRANSGMQPLLLGNQVDSLSAV